MHSSSKPTMILAVCWAWLPPPAAMNTSGCGNAEFLEEDVVHFAVVVLAGMDDLERQGLPGPAGRARSARFS
jgi:hypothetical protein